MYKIRGKITEVQEQEINTDKGDFVKKLVTIEELDTGFKHIQQFEIFGQEKINVIEHSKKLEQGQVVDIDFYMNLSLGLFELSSSFVILPFWYFGKGSST